ncbi:hypothetical protein MTR_5g069400 [Medicago truncatula]|uniref:Reverse transcriptase zinc-binding domain-containing protein n=1 Tax=Medicago truncatula TaxID=3880 RepID=G7KE14_MEDTR|nr:hypothetical protein MTR_5g069400 [Medicago truncatula]
MVTPGEVCCTRENMDASLNKSLKQNNTTTFGQVEEILSHTELDQSDMLDLLERWKWLLDLIQGYSVCGAYQFLMYTKVPLDRERFHDVWHNHIPLKVSLFDLNQCPTCCGSHETPKHLFLVCASLGSVWPLLW